jgi:hypothetical protein
LSWSLLWVLSTLPLAVSADAEAPAEKESPARSVRIGIHLQEGPQPPVPIAGRLRLKLVETTSAGSEMEAGEIVLAVSIPGHVEVPPPAGAGWVVRLEAPGLWMAPQWLEAAGGGAAELRPLRAGEIEIPLRKADEDPLPAAATVTFGPSPVSPTPRGPSRRTQGPRGSASCAIADGSARCTVPVGELDLRLEAPGYGPMYFWNVAVRPQEDLRLEPAPLARGASLSGWVVLPRHAGETAARPKVQLAPRVQGRPSSPEVRDRLSLQTLTTRAEENGFFHIAGLKPGAYALTVSMDDMAPSRRFPIWISASEENRLDRPIELGPPAQLRVSIDPPADPYSRPWKLSVQRESEISDTRVEVLRRGVAEGDGSYRTDGLPPGAYLFRIEGEDGSRWVDEPFELGPGQVLDLYVPVPLVEVVGTLTLGEEPLEGRLAFSHRKLGSSIPMTADERGEFGGFLPGEGEWRVDVRPAAAESGKPAQELQAGVVTVRRAPGDRAAELTITLPATRIEGRVFDGAGAPVPEGVVTAWVSEGPDPRRLASTRVDEEGGFSLAGLPPGLVALEAQAESGARGGPLSLVLEEDRALDSVVLVVRETLSIETVVSSGGRPVPYASMRIRVTDPATGGLVSLWAATATTDASGRTTLRVPQGDLDLLLSSASCPTTLRSIPAARLPGLAEEGLHLELADSGGTLVFDAGEVVAAADPGAVGRTFLYHGGGSAALEELLRLHPPQMISADTFALDRMAPGPYTVCQAWADGGTACSDGFLPAGGELRIGLETRTSREAD